LAQAASRVREFLLSRIQSLKKPKTNVQVIQQTVLLKYKYFLRFLFKHSPETGIEIRDSYTSTMASVSLLSLYLSLSAL
jgi:hypothetical protein